jgi:hypothetical protein
LVQEPFVSGADTWIDRVVADIPNAENGFTLIFSSTPFPGHQYRLDWRRAESGGNWYYSADLDMEGWLGAALVAGLAMTVAGSLSAQQIETPPAARSISAAKPSQPTPPRTVVNCSGPFAKDSSMLSLATAFGSKNVTYTEIEVAGNKVGTTKTRPGNAQESFSGISLGGLGEEAAGANEVGCRILRNLLKNLRARLNAAPTAMAGYF